MEKIFVLIEEFSNDGAIECDVLGVSQSKEKLDEILNKQIEVYERYGCFDDEDFEKAEKDDFSYFVKNDDYYGKLDIIEKKIL